MASWTFLIRIIAVGWLIPALNLGGSALAQDNTAPNQPAPTASTTEQHEDDPLGPCGQAAGRRQADDMIAICDKALQDKRLPPVERAAALTIRGAGFAMKGDNEHAMADFNEAVVLSPREPAAYWQRGLVLEARSDYQSAIRDLSKAIELKPDLTEAYSARGVANFGLGNLTAALKDLDDAISRSPRDAVALY